MWIKRLRNYDRRCDRTINEHRPFLRKRFLQNVAQFQRLFGRQDKRLLTDLDFDFGYFYRVHISKGS